MTNQEKATIISNNLNEFSETGYCSVDINANLTIGFRYLECGGTAEITSVRNQLPSVLYCSTTNKNHAIEFVAKELQKIIK